MRSYAVLALALIPLVATAPIVDFEDASSDVRDYSTTCEPLLNQTENGNEHSAVIDDAGSQPRVGAGTLTDFYVVMEPTCEVEEAPRRHARYDPNVPLFFSAWVLFMVGSLRSFIGGVGQ